jgi:hypothetical protein
MPSIFKILALMEIYLNYAIMTKLLGMNYKKGFYAICVQRKFIKLLKQSILSNFSWFSGKHYKKHKTIWDNLYLKIIKLKNRTKFSKKNNQYLAQTQKRVKKKKINK